MEQKPFESPYSQAAKLFRKARKHKLDEGYNKFYSILRDKHCDKGTALLMYWMSSPEHATRYADASEVPDWALDNYDFVKHVEERYPNMRKEEIIYDPTEDGRVKSAQYKVKTPIPKIMRKKSPGTVHFSQIDVAGIK